MNKRIKELAYSCFHVDTRDQIVRVNDYDIERFARLIIDECITVAGPEDSYMDQWISGKIDSVKRIKEHFGVEE